MNLVALDPPIKLPLVGREGWLIIQADRKRLLADLECAQDTNSKLKTELAAYGAADPVKYERKKRAIEVCKESALRWTGR